MKVEAVFCDRCDRRVTNEREDLALVRIQRGDRIRARDLCPLCEAELDLFLRGAPLLASDPDPAIAAVDAALLAEARRVANRGIEEYGEGASADVLAERLRDVASAARRRA